MTPIATPTRALTFAVLAAVAPLIGCDITETGFSCIPTCAVICDAPSDAAYFSAEVLVAGEAGRVRLVERLGGTAEVGFQVGDEVDHEGLWFEVEPGAAVIVSFTSSDNGESPASGGGFPLDAGGANVLCSDSNPQDPDIPIAVEDYIALSGAEECTAELEERGIPTECEDTP